MLNQRHYISLNQIHENVQPVKLGNAIIYTLEVVNEMSIINN
jgi:hypothetical protein